MELRFDATATPRTKSIGPTPKRILLSLRPADAVALDANPVPRRDWLAAAMAAELTDAERDLLRIAGDLMDRLADWPGQPLPGRHRMSYASAMYSRLLLREPRWI